MFQKINDFREKHNLRKLMLEHNLPDFIKNEISENILFNSQHLFKFGNNKYLLKYELYEFKNYFKNNNEELINILLKKDLNTVIILTQGIIQYIYLKKYK